MNENVEAEKKLYCQTVKVFNSTYNSDDKIDKRITNVFNTFARILHGRKNMSKDDKRREIERLCHTVRTEIVYPLLQEDQIDQETFDHWHKSKVGFLKKECPIKWNQGSTLTVGMSQKIINLLCKDLWALNLVDNKISNCFHVIIDKVTLSIMNNINKQLSWTQIDSYEEYMNLQWVFKEIARNKGLHSLVLECINYNHNR